MFESIPPELLELGLTPFFLQQLHALDTEAELGRIACERRGEYEVLTARGLARAALSGRLSHELPEDERPTVGDWVVMAPAKPVGRVERLLERQSVLRRMGVDGTSRAQNLAANVDLCCVVAALTPPDVDRHARKRALNPRRIERYLVTADSCRIPALVLVNKADVLDADAAHAAVAELTAALPRARTLLVSAETGLGLAALSAELAPTSSAVLLGSSGVGKSTLINALLGSDAQRTSAERAGDTRGRHTTTERQLRRLAGGALLIDTPGMRELSLWADAEGDDAPALFDDIAVLSEACRFRDCSHRGEPGCAVAAAVEAGTLSLDRLAHAHKLERELAHQRARVDVRLREKVHQAHKVMSRAARARVNDKRRM